MAKSVLHILSSLAIGGAENLVLDLLKYNSSLDSKDVEFKVVYMHNSPVERVDMFEKALGGGENLKFIECSKGIKGTCSFVKGLRRYVKENEFDTIHCHNNVDAYWAYFAVAGLKFSPKIILTVHGMNLNFLFLSQKMKGCSVLERKILKSLQIKYVSGVTEEFYREKYNWNELEGEVVYNGINWEKFNFSVERMPGERPTFAMVGNFNTPVRLQRMLCEALVSIAPLPFKFLFIGAKNSDFPYLYDDCVKICEDAGILDKDVIFLGKRDDVPQFLHQIEGYVYASSADTFGISVVEAAGVGLPVLCSDIQTFREVLQNGKYGKLIPNTPDEFAHEMLLLARSIKEEASTCVKASELRDTYSIERCFKNYYL